MMFDDTYKTITELSEGIYKEKGSKFFSFAMPVKTEEEIKEKLAELRKTYFDARHHCYAYILGFDKSAWRANDDGEPSGTGGKPIYGQLLSHDLTNVLIVVIRYFGGVKLGVSGLINAYKTAAKNAIDNNKIIMLTIQEIYTVDFDYMQMNNIMKVLKDESVKIYEQNFDNQCQIKFSVRQSKGIFITDQLSKISGSKIQFIALS